MQNEPATFPDRSHSLNVGAEVHFSCDETLTLLANMHDGGPAIGRIEAMEWLVRGEDKWLQTIYFHPPGTSQTDAPTVGAFLYQWSETDFDVEKVVSYFVTMLNGIDRPRNAKLTYAVWAEPR